MCGTLPKTDPVTTLLEPSARTTSTLTRFMNGLPMFSGYSWTTRRGASSSQQRGLGRGHKKGSGTCEMVASMPASLAIAGADTRSGTKFFP